MTVSGFEVDPGQVALLGDRLAQVAHTVESAGAGWREALALVVDGAGSPTLAGVGRDIGDAWSGALASGAQRAAALGLATGDAAGGYLAAEDGARACLAERGGPP